MLAVVMPAGKVTCTVTRVPPRPSGAVAVIVCTDRSEWTSLRTTDTVVLTVRLEPVGVTTCTGGSSKHHTMLADAVPANPNSIPPDATTPNTTLFADM